MFRLNYKFTSESPWQEEGIFNTFKEAYKASEDLLESGYTVEIEEV